MISTPEDASEMVATRSGWWLPLGDTYFPQFCQGMAPKRNGFFRDHLLEAFRYVKEWNCAIDVGAHVGFWTWDLAKRFSIVHAFEPTKTTYACLLKNITECENVQTYNLALGDSAGLCEIRNDHRKRSGKNSGSNFIVPNKRGSVQIATLDSMEFEHCDLLKVDVEGYEWHVLKGAHDLIKRCRPVISMECTDIKFQGRYNIPIGEAQRWLLKRGYREVWAQRPDKVFVAS